MTSPAPPRPPLEVFLYSSAMTDWLLLVVHDASSGRYSHQCAGMTTASREVAGLGIPCEGPESSRRLQAFFEGAYAWGTSVAEMAPAHVVELERLVGSVKPCGAVMEHGVHFTDYELRLDRSRLDEAVEGWLPVTYGPDAATLLFPNSD